MKQEFFQAVLHHLDLNKMLEKKTWWELNKDAVCYFEKILEAASY